MRILFFAPLALVLFGALPWAGVPAASAVEAPPLPVYPGARYLKQASEDYADDRGVEKVWIYALKADFKKVAAFYQSKVSSQAVAESQTDELYLAILANVEVRVEKQAGSVRLCIVPRNAPEPAYEPVSDSQDSGSDANAPGSGGAWGGPPQGNGPNTAPVNGGPSRGGPSSQPNSAGPGSWNGGPPGGPPPNSAGPGSWNSGPPGGRPSTGQP